MTFHPVLSTPCPLPRKREHVKKRRAIAVARVNGTSTRSGSCGLTHAIPLQKNEAPLARRKYISTIKIRTQSHRWRPPRCLARVLRLVGPTCLRLNMGECQQIVGVLPSAYRRLCKLPRALFQCPLLPALFARAHLSAYTRSPSHALHMVTYRGNYDRALNAVNDEIGGHIACRSR